MRAIAPSLRIHADPSIASFAPAETTVRSAATPATTATPATPISMAATAWKSLTFVLIGLTPSAAPEPSYGFY